MCVEQVGTPPLELHVFKYRMFAQYMDVNGNAFRESHGMFDLVFDSKTAGRGLD
jgi:hypothetical protein